MNDAYRFDLFRHDSGGFQVRVTDLALGLPVAHVFGESRARALLEAFIFAPCCPKKLIWLRWWFLRRQMIYRLRMAVSGRCAAEPTP